MKTVQFKNIFYDVCKILNENEILARYVVELKGKKVVFVYHKHFNDYLSDLKKLKKYGIQIPKIIKIDKKSNLIIQEHIDGISVFDLLKNEDLGDKVFNEIFMIYKFCRFSNINLDYSPDNYLFDGKRLFYTSNYYGVFEQDESFEDKGIYYWLYGKIYTKLLIERGFEINKTRLLTDQEARKKAITTALLYWQ